MAGRMRPFRAGHINVWFSDEDWSYLSSSVDLEIDAGMRLNIQECVDRYNAFETLHATALSRKDVLTGLRKLAQAFSSCQKRITALSNWTNLNDLKQGKVAIAVNDLFQIEHYEKFGTDYSLASAILMLGRLEEISVSCKTRVYYDVVYDNSLDIFLSTIAEKFDYIAAKGPQSKESLSFIHVLCAMLHKKLKKNDPNGHVFDTLGNVVRDTCEGSTGEEQGRVKQRILNGDKVRLSIGV